jgi:hypothetical protein
MASKSLPKKSAVKKPNPTAKGKPAKPKAPAPKTAPALAKPTPVPQTIEVPSVADRVTPPPALKASPPTAALTLSVQTSQGSASNGNAHPANILVVVTSGGSPVVELNRDHFTLMEHFEVPGQTAPFSNNITSFRNAGTGAYLLQTRPINGAPWRSGHHLGQLLICDEDERQGQAVFKLIIR